MSEVRFLHALKPALPVILPLASRWVRRQEEKILSEGVPLNKSQCEDASRAGVDQPCKIRLSFAEALPMPGGWVLGPLGKATGLVSPYTAGITLGYGISIRSPFRHDRSLIVHECVHVGQYERLGSIENFLRDYLRECLDPGYPWGPLEQEAIHRAQEIVSAS
jgi:hypothetical protein